jgi:hypothetical protein
MWVLIPLAVVAAVAVVWAHHHGTRNAVRTTADRKDL